MFAYKILGAALLLALAPLARADSQPLMLNNGEYAVPGILQLPNDNRPDPPKVAAVVMLHGTASQKDEVGNLYKQLAELLAGSGIATLRIDFAGTGNSPVDYLKYTPASAERDARTAVDYLSAQSRIDPARIGVIGFSQGGLIAQLLAEHDTRIKALVTWSSTAGDGAGPYQKLFDQYAAEARQNGFAVMNFSWRSPLKLSEAWFEQISAQTSMTDLKKFTGDQLAVAGSIDTDVPAVSSLQLLDASGARNAQMVLIKGADHTFNVLSQVPQPQTAELLRVTSQWFFSHL